MRLVNVRQQNLLIDGGVFETRQKIWWIMPKIKLQWYDISCCSDKVSSTVKWPNIRQNGLFLTFES